MLKYFPYMSPSSNLTLHQKYFGKYSLKTNKQTNKNPVDLNAFKMKLYAMFQKGLQITTSNMLIWGGREHLF